ncbi:MAG: O-antigen ligase family protein [Phycisphaerales bacterium]|nr:O-antigen ligase family protein [Phycisphaerales bacterium]
MSRAVTRFLVVIVITANAGATLFYSGTGPIDPASAMMAATTWNPVLYRIAEALTLPIPTGGIVDVRDGILLTLLGAALLVLGATMLLDGRRTPSQLRTQSQNPAERWLWITTGGVTIIAILSSIGNSSFDLSWGWIVRFAAGAGWAILLARVFTKAMIRQTVIGLLAVATSSLLLTIAHRADLHLTHFRWPIGPITITAALAAVWAALAAGIVATTVSHRRLNWGVILAFVTCLICIYVLQQTGRRAPALGFATGVGLVGAMLVWNEFKTRRAKVILLGIIAAAFISGASYVILQSRATERTKSGPIALRLALWKTSAGMIWNRLSLGSGPDTFVVEMTNALTPRRAESPHFYHGDISVNAHNEWIQSAVELGVPGGLFYLAVPLGPMWLAWRRRRAHAEFVESDGNERFSFMPDLKDRAILTALCAGLITVITTDAASITLRDSIMPVTYWTLIGLLAACFRKTVRHEKKQPVESDSTVRPSKHFAATIRAVVLIVLSIFCIGISYKDLSNARKSPAEASILLDETPTRLFSAKTLTARENMARRASRLARSHPDETRIEKALTRWRAHYLLIPGLADTPSRYADALLLGGRKDQARRVLEHALSPSLNPYEPTANTLYAKHFANNDPVAALRCVQRALRHSALNAALVEILKDAATDAGVNDVLRNELPDARKRVSSKTPPSATDVSIELLRIHAFLRFDAGQHAQALADQRLIAEYYAFLEKTNHRYRRGHDAETDAFFLLAKMLYESDPANYREAYDAIVAAERYAILGIRHDQVRNPQPEYGFVVGQVVPTETLPRRWYPLWNLSALLKVVSGHDQFLEYRIFFGRPPQDWNQRVLNRELARLARRAYEDLTRIPAGKRPRHYNSLPDMANRYSNSGS